MSYLELWQNANVEAATRVLDQMAPGTPVNADVAKARIDLLLYQRRFAEARAMAEEYADTFTTGPAAIDMAFARARVEQLAGNIDGAHAFYRAAIKLVNQPVNDIDHWSLAKAYAWLGDEKSAMREFAVVKADKRWSQGGSSEYQVLALAKLQLALGQKSAAIDSLRQHMVLRTKKGKPLEWTSPALLRIDPDWDPVRDHPRFQALLEQYADAAPDAAITQSATRN